MISELAVTPVKRIPECLNSGTRVHITRSSDVPLFENEKTIMTPIYWFVSFALVLLLILQPLSAGEAREVKRREDYAE
jgi:hypothetical protein